MVRRCKDDHDGGSDCAGRGRCFQDRSSTTTEHSPDAAGTLYRNWLTREVVHDRVKLAVGASIERLPEAIVELVGKQSALVGGASQLLSDVRSIGVRRAHVPMLCHLLAPSRIAACGSGISVRPHGPLTWKQRSSRLRLMTETERGAEPLGDVDALMR